MAGEASESILQGKEPLQFTLTPGAIDMSVCLDNKLKIVTVRYLVGHPKPNMFHRVTGAPSQPPVTSPPPQSPVVTPPPSPTCPAECTCSCPSPGPSSYNSPSQFQTTARPPIPPSQSLPTYSSQASNSHSGPSAGALQPSQPGSNQVGSSQVSSSNNNPASNSYSGPSGTENSFSVSNSYTSQNSNNNQASSINYQSPSLNSNQNDQRQNNLGNSGPNTRPNASPTNIQSPNIYTSSGSKSNQNNNPSSDSYSRPSSGGTQGSSGYYTADSNFDQSANFNQNTSPGPLSDPSAGWSVWSSSIPEVFGPSKIIFLFNLKIYGNSIRTK